MRKLDARQVPEQDAVRMQRALGRTGRARRVDHQRRIIGRCVGRRESRRRTRERLEQAFGAVVGTVDREHQRRQCVTDAAELREALRVGDQRARAGIRKAI
jgi:hypothetical protein